MADSNHVKKLREGVAVWNQWRSENPDVPIDLRSADLRDIELPGVNLREANLNSCNLRGANLDNADLSSATLRSAILMGARLRAASLSKADAVGAHLDGVDASDANFREADLTRSIFDRAKLLGANMSKAICKDSTLTSAELTYHHWRVFSPGSGGVCLEFDKHQLQECVQDDPRFRCDSVIYRMINTVTTKGFKTDQLPFVKRFPYRDEKEFRILFVDMAENNEFKQFEIPLSSIKRITLSPWMPKALVTAVKSTLKSIKGCQKLRVNRSTLVENERWKCAVNLKRK